MNTFNERPVVNQSPAERAATVEQRPIPTADPVQAPPLAPAPARKKVVTRDSRKPFGSQTQKLAYEARAGYHRHWFNDIPGRIVQALEAGYTHVENKEGEKVQRVVGVNAAGGPLIGLLLEIPEEWYQEDMARQEQANAEREHAIRTGSISGQPGKDGVYIPEQRGIKITRGRL